MGASSIEEGTDGDVRDPSPRRLARRRRPPSRSRAFDPRRIYQASSPEAIRAHAQVADLPVDEIVPVADVVVVRPDPQPVAA
jgi:hypothetical protein